MRLSGSTALMYAAYKGYLEIVKLLLKNGANVDSVNNVRIVQLYDL